MLAHQAQVVGVAARVPVRDARDGPVVRDLAGVGGVAAQRAATHLHHGRARRRLRAVDEGADLRESQPSPSSARVPISTRARPEAKNAVTVGVHTREVHPTVPTTRQTRARRPPPAAAPGRGAQWSRRPAAPRPAAGTPPRCAREQHGPQPAGLARTHPTRRAVRGGQEASGAPAGPSRPGRPAGPQPGGRASVAGRAGRRQLRRPVSRSQSISARSPSPATALSTSSTCATLRPCPPTATSAGRRRHGGPASGGGEPAAQRRRHPRRRQRRDVARSSSPLGDGSRRRPAPRPSRRRPGRRGVLPQPRALGEREHAGVTNRSAARHSAGSADSSACHDTAAPDPSTVAGPAAGAPATRTAGTSQARRRPARPAGSRSEAARTRPRCPPRPSAGQVDQPGTARGRPPVTVASAWRSSDCWLISPRWRSCRELVISTGGVVRQLDAPPASGPKRSASAGTSPLEKLEQVGAPGVEHERRPAGAKTPGRRAAARVGGSRSSSSAGVLRPKHGRPGPARRRRRCAL